MLNNAASLPPEPVDNRADATGIIVQEPLRIYVCRAKNSDIDCGPQGTEQVEGSIGAVTNQWIVVLELRFLLVRPRHIRESILGGSLSLQCMLMK